MKHSKNKKNWTKKKKKDKPKTKQSEKKERKKKKREREREKKVTLPTQRIFPNDFSHVIYLALYQNIERTKHLRY